MGYVKDERIKQIQLCLEINGRMTYSELNEKFPNVSEMTIRRYVSELEKMGCVVRVTGGAVSLAQTTKYTEGGILDRANLNIFEKLSIAEKAVSLAEENATLFIDGGSTTTLFARELPDRDYRVVTNGINVAAELTSKLRPKVLIIGGEFSKKNESTFGRRAEAFLASEMIDVAFMATPAYSYNDGFSCSEREEAELKSYILTRARKRVMLLDSSKLDKTLSYTFARIENVDYIVTDDNFPENRKAEFRKRGVRVV